MKKIYIKLLRITKKELCEISEKINNIVNKIDITNIYTTDLYKLYNTNIHERIVEMKAKESRELSEKTD